MNNYEPPHWDGAQFETGVGDMLAEIHSLVRTPVANAATLHVIKVSFCSASCFIVAALTEPHIRSVSS